MAGRGGPLERPHLRLGLAYKAGKGCQTRPVEPQPGVVELDLNGVAATLSQHLKGRDVAELKGVQQGAQVVRAKLNGGVFPDQMQRAAGAAADEPVLSALGEALEGAAGGRMHRLLEPAGGHHSGGGVAVEGRGKHGRERIQEIGDAGRRDKRGRGAQRVGIGLEEHLVPLLMHV